eukprot:6184759-Pleurochrysis_carterae.AAC.1
MQGSFVGAIKVSGAPRVSPLHAKPEQSSDLDDGKSGDCMRQFKPLLLGATVTAPLSMSLFAPLYTPSVKTTMTPEEGLFNAWHDHLVIHRCFGAPLVFVRRPSFFSQNMDLLWISHGGAARLGSKSCPWSPPSGGQATNSRRLLEPGLQHAVHRRACTLPRSLRERSCWREMECQYPTISLAIGENFVAACSTCSIQKCSILLTGQGKKQTLNLFFIPTLINPACWKLIYVLLPTSELPAAPPTAPTVAPPRRPLLPPAAMAYRP